MAWPAFPSIPLRSGQAEPLLVRLTADCQVWGPWVESGGYCRLRPLARVPVAPRAELSFLPLKKLLFPDGDPLWRLVGKSYAQPESPPQLLLADVPLCDLQALHWLDRVFADDELYASRRNALLIMGAPCVPSAACHCRPNGLTPGGDLFRTADRLWALSPRGEVVLAAAGGDPPETLPLPGPDAESAMAVVDEKLFAASAGTSLWDEEAARCLACGACSAVCPTCICYEVLDEPRLDGSVSRHRVWDNCFFPDHARVAGGFDFRAGRGTRLRFRFEHKRLGFGALRGLSSCVGCGRCRRACPVGIDLEPVARRLVGAVSS